MTKEKKFEILRIVLLIIIILSIIVIFFIIKNKEVLNNRINKENNEIINKEKLEEKIEEEKEESIEDKIKHQTEVKEKNQKNSKKSDDLLLTEVNVNDITIKLPATKESFYGTNWTWNSEDAKKQLKPNYAITGGTLGNKIPSAIVGIINKSSEIRKYEDCIINDITFLNNEKKIDKIEFIGGISLGNNINTVKQILKKKGFVNFDEEVTNTTINLKYYLNDDKNNYKDTIEFVFVNDNLQIVSINAK